MSDQPTTPEPQNPDTPCRCGGRRPSSGSLASVIREDLESFGDPINSAGLEFLDAFHERAESRISYNDQQRVKDCLRRAIRKYLDEIEKQLPENKDYPERFST